MPPLSIDRLGHHGDGIAAGPVYAARTLPGELVEGRLDGDRLTDVRVCEPSPQRVSPPCRHYGACGGCALQHAADGFVSAWKADVVRHALAAQGLEAPRIALSTSPENSRRRATLHGRRTKKGALVGFHGRASDVIAEVPHCRLLRPEIVALTEPFETLVTLGGSRKGTLDLTVTWSESGADIAVAGGKPLDHDLRMELALWAEATDVARLSWGDETLSERRPPWQSMGRARVAPPPGAFLQATAEGEAALVAAVRAAVGDAARIADLFAGCGTFALPLAEHAEIHAVEGAAAMLAALDRGWRQTKSLRRVTTEARDLFRRPVLPDELDRFDAAVVDPPRAGAEAQVAALADSRVARIAMVSCNPVTFARDAKRLVSAGLSLTALRVVDQFRWSPHVELVAAFTRS